MKLFNKQHTITYLYKGFSISLIIILFTIVLSGCTTNNKDKSKKMLNYLENKYGESFEIENFHRGSSLFADTYGGDEAMVHPVNNKNLPFKVYKNTESSGYDDNYVISDMSYRYTEKYKKDIQKMTKKEIDIKFAFAFSNPPEDPDVLELPIDQVAEDMTYKGIIGLEIAIKTENKQDTKGDKEFLINVDKYMRNNTERNYSVSVGYIKSDSFDKADKAKELIRIAHTINFSWELIGDSVLDTIYFERKSNINSP